MGRCVAAVVYQPDMIFFDSIYSKHDNRCETMYQICAVRDKAMEDVKGKL